jgi:hypothetical protein
VYIVRPLTIDDVDAIKPLITQGKVASVDVNKNLGHLNCDISRAVVDNFTNRYLKISLGFTAFGTFDKNGQLLNILCTYDSIEEASWYWLGVFSSHKDPQSIKICTSRVLDIKESKEYYKYFSLIPTTRLHIARRFYYSDEVLSRYDFFDEYTILKNTQTPFLAHWMLLQQQIVFPIDMVVRCSFLRQQYRTKQSKI